MLQAFLSILNEVSKVKIKTVLLASASILVTALLGGYVVSTLWEWFVVPTFTAPPLNVVPAIGIALIVRLLTYNVDDYTEPTNESPDPVDAFMFHIFMGIVLPLVCLGIGWVFHFFM